MSDSPERVSIETQSPSQAVLEALRELIPGSVSDGVIDAQRIGEAAGLPVAGIKDGSERFGLMWAGKSKAVEALQALSMAALAPDMENSINWDTAENVFIEGDNLEVLKLLQKAYNNQVKLIYIDPPYNTGNDFIYNDDFSQPLKHYLEVTGQVDAEGNRLVANTEVSGRKHSNWLSMMYPRLLLARNLLTPDGAMFISIDDNELSRLLLLLEEVFGEENIKTIVVKMSEATGVKMAGVSEQGRIPKLKEYLVIAKPSGIKNLNIEKIPKDKWDEEYNSIILGATREEISAVKAILLDEDRSENDLFELEQLVSKWQLKSVSGHFASEKISKDKEINYKFENSWRIVQIASLTGSVRDLAVSKKKQFAAVPPFFTVVSPRKKCYLIRGDFNESSDLPRCKVLFADDYLTVHVGDFWSDIKTTGLDNEGGVDFKSGKKPLKLMERILEMGTSPGDIVMDFFAGSGTTAEACLRKNYNLKFVLVTLAEEIHGESGARNQDCKTVSDISRLRIKKAISSINDGNQRGLRCLRLEKSLFFNASANEDTLFGKTQMVVASNEHLAAEILLKNGRTLDKPWNRIELSGEDAVVSDGVCVVLARVLNDEIVEAAKVLDDAHTVIFLEDAFAGLDSVKANAVLGFKQANKIMKTI